MSKINTFVDLRSIQTLQDVLSTNWMDLTDVTAMGNHRPYFIPDCEMEGIKSIHYKVRIVKGATSALDFRLDLRRVEELSDFPDCPVLLTGYKGDLYVKPKSPREAYSYGRCLTESTH